MKTIQKRFFKKRRQEKETKRGPGPGLLAVSFSTREGSPTSFHQPRPKPSSWIRPWGRPGAEANYSSRLLASSHTLGPAASQQEREPLLALVSPSPTRGYHQDLSEPVSVPGPDTIEKSRIRETKNLSTDADRRTNTILERLLLGKKNKK